jgi:hypothetical protein
MEMPSPPSPKRKSRLRRALLIMVLLWLGITVIRETGMLKLDYFRSDIESQTLVNWSGMSMDMPMQAFISPSGGVSDSLDAQMLRWSEDPCNRAGMGHRRRVVVQYDINKVEGGGDCAEIMVGVQHFRFGLYWTPLIKRVHFTADANCTAVFLDYFTQDNVQMRNQNSRGGTIQIQGTATIKGFCSARTAKKLILSHVMNQFLQEGEKEAAKY